MAARSPRLVLRLRATLLGSDPEIWRTVDVDGSLTLAQLHHVLQTALGWQNQHLHRFTDADPWERRRGIPRIGRRSRRWLDEWSIMDRFADDDEPDEDERETTIAEAFAHDGPLWYEYDFGDDWTHRIDLIERVRAEPGERPATVVAGERRAPLEDSGGLGGYEEKLEIIADPQHPEHEHIKEWMEWVAGPWGSTDPDEFDPDAVQGELDLLFGGGSDMSGLAGPARGIAPDSPIALLAADLPVPARINLRRHLHRTGVLDAVQIDADAAAELVRPYLWLLSRIGEEGMTLTKAGWMPPAAVLEGMTELGWRDRWIGEANREDFTAPMLHLRASAERLRLIRKVKGRLELIARVRPIAADPSALLDEVTRMLLRQRMSESHRAAGALLVLGIADGTVSTRDDAERVVLTGLEALGFTDADGRAPDRRWFPTLTEPVWEVLRALGLWKGADRRVDAPPTAALRAVARAALR